MILKYVLESGAGSVVLTETVISTLLQFRQRKLYDKEAGGQLFAQFEGADTFIEYVSSPKRSDKRGRFSFKPDRIMQLADIANCYKEGRHFVGDWHTHPQAIPNPSSVDIRSMIECFNKSKHGLKAFLIIIVGAADPPQGFYVGLVTGNELKALKLVS